MSRDYKKVEPRGRSGTLILGVFIGLALGLVAALAIAFYLNRANPFTPRDKPQATAPASGKAANEPAKAIADPASAAADPGKAAENRPRFDFYTILPGVEQPASEQELRKRSAEGKDKEAEVPRERFFLQAGAFQSAPDADNLKARLALMGLEASIQTANLGDKGIWHRVRLGPFDDADVLAKVRAQLAAGGVEATSIKVRDKAP